MIPGMEREEIVISTKNKKLRTVLFVLAFFVAVSAFTYGITSLGHKDPGYHEVEVSEYKKVELFDTGIHLYYSFEGNSNQIKRQINELKEIYTTALDHAWKMLDKSTEYEGYHNLAYLNHHLNEDVEVDEELVRILQDAWKKSDTQKYSVFAGPLFDQWKEILYADDPQTFDPLYNEVERQRLEELCACLQDPQNYDLRFQGNTVHVYVSDTFLTVLKDNEYPEEILDLNLLRDAYLLENIRDQLAGQGWRKGYLESEKGMILGLGEMPVQECVLYTYDEDVVQAGSFPVQEKTAVCRIKTFSAGETGYYVLEEDSLIFRHPYLELTGYPRNDIRSLYAADEMGDLVETSYQAAVSNPAAIHAPWKCIYTLSDDPMHWITDTPEFFTLNQQN